MPESGLRCRRSQESPHSVTLPLNPRGTQQLRQFQSEQVWIACLAGICSLGPRSSMLAPGKPSGGIIAVGSFLFFGAIMACLAGLTLTRPGTLLDRIWRLNAPAYARLAPLGKPAGILFLLLSATLAIAATGWFRLRVWGWRLAVAVIATQVLGDLVNMFTGDLLRGSIGFLIAAALLIYLLRPAVRRNFSTGNNSSVPTEIPARRKN